MLQPTPKPTPKPTPNRHQHIYLIIVLAMLGSTMRVCESACCTTTPDLYILNNCVCHICICDVNHSERRNATRKHSIGLNERFSDTNAGCIVGDGAYRSSTADTSPGRNMRECRRTNEPAAALQRMRPPRTSAVRRRAPVLKPQRFTRIAMDIVAVAASCCAGRSSAATALHS